MKPNLETSVTVMYRVAMTTHNLVKKVSFTNEPSHEKMWYF